MEELFVISYLASLFLVSVYPKPLSEPQVFQSLTFDLNMRLELTKSGCLSASLCDLKTAES